MVVRLMMVVDVKMNVMKMELAYLDLLGSLHHIHPYRTHPFPTTHSPNLSHPRPRHRSYRSFRAHAYIIHECLNIFLCRPSHKGWGGRAVMSRPFSSGAWEQFHATLRFIRIRQLHFNFHVWNIRRLVNKFKTNAISWIFTSFMKSAIRIQRFSYSW